MASINTLVDLITDGVMTDAAIIAWAAATYDTTHAVFENCDPRSDPGPDDCPLIVVTPTAKTAGLSSTVKGHVVHVSCLVHDEDTETTLHGVVRFLAGRRAEEMRVLTVAAIRSALPDDIHIESIDTEFMPLDEYPLAAATMILNLTQEKLIGANPYE